MSDASREHEDRLHLRSALALARQAMAHGNEPFGALLVDAQGAVILGAENTQVTERDCTGHAETNLAREAGRRYTRALLCGCTLYASCEPCPMCAGAIYWSGIGRLAYALGHPRARLAMGKSADEPYLSCREVLARNRRRVEVVGPLLEDEAARVLEAYPWR